MVGDNGWNAARSSSTPEKTRASRAFWSLCRYHGYVATISKGVNSKTTACIATIEAECARAIVRPTFLSAGRCPHVETDANALAKKRAPPPESASTRSMNGTPSRKGCVVKGHMTQASNK